MTRLAPCAACHRHVRLGQACPFCGAPAPVETVREVTTPRAAGLGTRSELVLGLVASAVALSSAGCCNVYGGPPAPAYGGPPVPITTTPVVESPTPPAPAAPTGPTLPATETPPEPR